MIIYQSFVVDNFAGCCVMFSTHEHIYADYISWIRLSKEATLKHSHVKVQVQTDTLGCIWLEHNYLTFQEVLLE